MSALFGRRFDSAHLHKNPIDKIYCEISEKLDVEKHPAFNVLYQTSSSHIR